MKATIKRTYVNQQSEGTFTLTNNGETIFTCKTLELPNLNNQQSISCIPEGIYPVVKHTSPSQGRCFAVNNVPGRGNILIHKGNYSGSKNPKTGKPDILGCILVGSAFGDINGDGIPEITNSTATLKKLLGKTEGFELTITSV